jgi:hypothetical protein
MLRLPDGIAAAAAPAAFSEAGGSSRRKSVKKSRLDRLRFAGRRRGKGGLRAVNPSTEADQAHTAEPASDPRDSSSRTNLR